ncbi:MAG TPA: AzlD domain-containing protein [Acidimicrobiia bacterium]|nr:AzlD domain-containing protein [Acidimicrobiia bacterium]
MSYTPLILLVAIITFSSRAMFLVFPLKSARVRDSAFLASFPVALFVTIATVGIAAPEGVLDVSPSLWAGVGGILGAVLFRRSILGVVVVGVVGYWVARLWF